MEQTVRRDRHHQLWEASSTSVRRMAISGLLFAAVVFFNVLEPYSKTMVQREGLARIEQKMVGVGDSLRAVEKLQLELEQVATTVANAPWTRHKNDLIQRFARREVHDAQAEADKTIRKIAVDFQASVVAPLEKAVSLASAPEDLKLVPTKIARIVDAWKRDHEGQRWFQTIHTKEATVLKLDESVEDIQVEASEVVKRIQATVKAKKQKLTGEQQSLATQFAGKQQELQEALDAAIPAWAKGMISVDQMVFLYPFILIGLAVYLVVRGITGAGHYEELAKLAAGPKRSDPIRFFRRSGPSHGGAHWAPR